MYTHTVHVQTVHVHTYTVQVQTVHVHTYTVQVQTVHVHTHTSSICYESFPLTLLHEEAQIEAIKESVSGRAIL